MDRSLTKEVLEQQLYSVMGWRPSLGPVGGLHSARPRVVSRKVVAIVWLGFDTVLARAFLWSVWLMSIYRELLARQIDE